MTARHNSGGLAGVTCNVMSCTNVCVLKNKNSVHNFCDKLLERKFLGIGDESVIKMEHKEVHWFIAVFRCWLWFW